MPVTEHLFTLVNRDQNLNKDDLSFLCIMAPCAQAQGLRWESIYFSKCSSLTFPVVKVWEKKCECQRGLRNAARCHLTKVSELPWILSGFEVIKAWLWQFGHVHFHLAREGEWKNLNRWPNPQGDFVAMATPPALALKHLCWALMTNAHCEGGGGRQHTFFSVLWISPVNFSSVALSFFAAEKLENEHKQFRSYWTHIRNQPTKQTKTFRCIYLPVNDFYCQDCGLPLRPNSISSTNGGMPVQTVTDELHIFSCSAFIKWSQINISLI